MLGSVYFTSFLRYLKLENSYEKPQMFCKLICINRDAQEANISAKSNPPVHEIWRLLICNRSKIQLETTERTQLTWCCNVIFTLPSK